MNNQVRFCCAFEPYTLTSTGRTHLRTRVAHPTSLPPPLALQPSVPQHKFHRACLAENRRAGNIGCPCCRGPLERGLTPTPTAAERRATADRQALSEARGATLDSALVAMVAVREALTVISNAGPAPAVVAAAEPATLAARSTQEAVSTVLAVVRSTAPSVTMYAAASVRLEASRVELVRTVAALTAAVAQAGGGGGSISSSESPVML